MLRRTIGMLCLMLSIVLIGIAFLFGGDLFFLSPFSLFLSVLSFALGVMGVIALRHPV